MTAPMTLELLAALGRATLYSTAAAGAAWLLLGALRVQSPRVHRLTWLLVLAQGWLLFPWTLQVEQAASAPPPS